MAKKTDKKKEAISPEQELYDLRKAISALKDREKVLNQQVLGHLQETGQRRGERFTIALKQTLRVTEPELAFSWAAERGCLAVDTTRAMKILRREFEIPEFFEVRKTEYLRIAGAHSDETNYGDDS